MTIKEKPALLQFDSSGTVLNSLEMAGYKFEGVIVFAAGGSFWLYGTSYSNSVIFALNDDFTLVDNKELPSTQLKIGTSDGNGHAYFLGSLSSKTRLLKLKESDYSIVFEKEYGHIS